jgi:hypothetical protein
MQPSRAWKFVREDGTDCPSLGNIDLKETHSLAPCQGVEQMGGQKVEVAEGNALRKVDAKHGFTYLCPKKAGISKEINMEKVITMT